MFYIPSAPSINPLPSLSSFHTYGSFLRDRPLSPLEQPILSTCLFRFPRSIKIETVADVHRSKKKLIIQVENLDTSHGSHTPEDHDASFTTSGSWGALQIGPGDGSMLVRMGLVPSLSQDSVMVRASSNEDEDLEIEVFRNASRDTSSWRASSVQLEQDLIHDLESHIDVHGSQEEAWSLCSSPEPLSPNFSTSPMEANLLASSTSFFEQMLASSSPMTSSTRASRNIGALIASDDSFEFSFPLSPSGSTTNDAEYAMGGFELSVDLEDMNLDTSLHLAGRALGFDAYPSLLEDGIPSLPTESDVIELLACGAVMKTRLSDTPPLPNLPSAPSFIIPTSSSMESLLRMSLDIPELSFDSCSSISGLLSGSAFASTYHFPTFPPAEDLIRVEPPSDFNTYDADMDTFTSLPHDTISPFASPILS